MISKLRYILFIIIFAIAIYYYIYNRTAGCKNKEAINFNPEADIGDDMKCIYNTLGCLDKNAGNYNKFATVSCTEDCLGCEEKGTCDLCNNHRECKNECTDCICKPKVKGCNRTWALNYDPNATNDNGSCMSKEDFLKKINYIDRTKYNDHDENYSYANVGKYGDCLLFDPTNCFHSAGIPEENYKRDYLIITYVCVPKKKEFLEKFKEVDIYKYYSNKLLSFSKPTKFFETVKIFLNFYSSKMN